MKNALGVLSLILLVGASHSSAQTAANHVGVVTAIDPAAKQIKIKTDAGAELSVALQERTNYLRVGADLNMKNAAKIALGDVAVGDRVLARGALSEDKATLTATSIVVMTKEEVAKKHEAEQASTLRAPPLSFGIRKTL
jgi:hypothetical protein